MAWLAELKRRKWYCIVGLRMIYVYKKKLYDDWYNSLTEEQKQELEDYRKRKREKLDRELQESFNRLNLISQAIGKAYNGFYRELL